MNEATTETAGTAKVLVTFGEAIKALNQGKRIQRHGWNGKGLFVFKQVPSTVGKDIIPKMSSLPQSVKDEFERRKNLLPKQEQETFDIRYSDQMALVDVNNRISGWSPSSKDTLANDWIILD